MLSWIDWTVVAVYLLVTISIGVLFKNRASENVESYFVAGRNMGWFALGTSIMATTFASDTPLAIAGFVAKYGISGNWIWWNSIFATMAVTVFFARKWRMSKVITDAELVELRYGGRPAEVLRLSKAFLSAFVLNCITMGWVITAMTKITKPLIKWPSILGNDLFYTLEGLYPSMLVIKDFNSTISIVLMSLVVLVYAVGGGLRAVIITDVMQFFIALGCAYLLAWYAVSEVGGLSAMWTKLDELYPDIEPVVTIPDATSYLSATQIKQFLPSFSQASGLAMPFSAFLLAVGFMWWTNTGVDGNGYVAQRLYSAKTPQDAEKGMLWNTYGQSIFRHWPWVIAGVVALILYPRAEFDQLAREMTMCLNDSRVCSEAQKLCLEGGGDCPIAGFDILYKTDGTLAADGVPHQLVATTLDTSATITVFKEDREATYPQLIKDLLPTGLLGLMFVSLMAAFMSTISTHINWGASYLTNDIYHRFLHPDAGQKRLVFVSRMSTVLILVLALMVSSQIDSVGKMWELAFTLAGGMGLPHLLRWLWWRANAWTEISGMIAAFTLGFVNLFYFDGDMFQRLGATHPFHVISYVSLISGIICITATFITKPVDQSLLLKFIEQVRPMGFWSKVKPDYKPAVRLSTSLITWVMGSASVYLGLFGTGYIVRTDYGYGMILVGLSLVSFFVVYRRLSTQK